MNSADMTLRWIEGQLMMLILLGVTEDTSMLPAPMNASMESVNMKHKLSWTPLQAQCNTTVLYSVQYQGEFELLLRNGSWVDAAECQRIAQTHCDLTFDLGSDSDYNLRVRGQCGAQLSAWTKLSQPFNRRNTILKVPEMRLTTAGGSLQVSFKELPLTATISVIVWKKGAEMQPAAYLIPAEQKVLPVADLQEGAVYCVVAQIVLDSGLRSNNTDPRCLAITGPEAAAWKRPTTVTVTVLITAGLLLAVLWFILNFKLDVCLGFHKKVPLPQSLSGTWDTKSHVRPEEEEEILAVLSVHPVQQTTARSAATANCEDRK